MPPRSYGSPRISFARGGRLDHVVRNLEVEIFLLPQRRAGQCQPQILIISGRRIEDDRILTRLPGPNRAGRLHADDQLAAESRPIGGAALIVGQRRRVVVEPGFIVDAAGLLAVFYRNPYHEVGFGRQREAASQQNRRILGV